MAEVSANSKQQGFGSEVLDKMVIRLQKTSDPHRKYEYVLWLAKKLTPMRQDYLTESFKVKGCVSQVYVFGELKEGKVSWQGYSDALITKGLLAFLVQGLSNLTPQEIMNIDPSFIASTGLSSSLTPSRANGFLNILLTMKAQAKALAS